MNQKHGLLESIILNALWELEKTGTCKNSVKDVCDLISKSNTEARAYTTIKTVMDRMFEKEFLLRTKQGKKFYYRTAYSYDDIVKNSLEKVAERYCEGDMVKLLRFVQALCEKQGALTGASLG
jgi:predicted transcriptional regulator